jgi:hypothetical protein
MALAGIGGTAQTYLVYRPDVWAPRVDAIFKARLVAAKFFSDFSDYVTEGGKSINIPTQAYYTTASVTTTTGDITANVVVDSRTILDINTWKHVSRVFADYQAAQVSSNYRLKEIFADSMAYALAKDLDSAILALVTATNPAPVAADTTNGIRSSTLESALSLIESYNIPREECMWFFSPKTYYKEIMAIQKLYDASQFGKPSLIMGTHDTLYGVPVTVTTQVPNASITDVVFATTKGHVISRNAILHNSFAAYALGNLPNGTPSGVRIQEKASENLRTTVVGDIMYGVKAVGGSYKGCRVLGSW